MKKIKVKKDNVQCIHCEGSREKVQNEEQNDDGTKHICGKK